MNWPNLEDVTGGVLLAVTIVLALVALWPS